MPNTWSEKRERQYRHIKDSQQERGATEEKAKEIAARTVNKQRRENGATSTKTTSGTGNPNKALDQRKKQELYNLAKQRNIKGRSSMSKDQLISALRHDN